MLVADEAKRRGTEAEGFNDAPNEELEDFATLQADRTPVEPIDIPLSEYCAEREMEANLVAANIIDNPRVV